MLNTAAQTPNQMETPYYNLILAGYIGGRRMPIAKLIAASMRVPFIDIDIAIQQREGRHPDEIRQYFGEARLNTIEEGLITEISLQRSCVISLGGSMLLDSKKREAIEESGYILVLTCALDEILHRVYTTQGARFHDPKARSTTLNIIRRENQIRRLPGLTTLDTTYLSNDQVAEAAIQFWSAQPLIKNN